jgi:hypothetical protein
MKPIVFAPDASAEFEAAVNWYEAKAELISSPAQS